MNPSTQLIIKPYKDNYFAWISDLYVLFFIPVVVDTFVDIFTDINVEWKWYGLAFILYSVIIFTIAGIARFCYKGKLIVTEDEVIKFHGKKIQFRIKKKILFLYAYKKLILF